MHYKRGLFLFLRIIVEQSQISFTTSKLHTLISFSFNSSFPPSFLFYSYLRVFLTHFALFFSRILQLLVKVLLLLSVRQRKILNISCTDRVRPKE